jgi:hypothetical protein
MTPKQKAEDLFYEMSTNSSDEDHHCSRYVAKNCALIAINEILSVITNSNDYYIMSNYYQQVKKEIENL